MIRIRWDLRTDAEIVTITAIDEDTGPNTGRVYYELTSSSYPLPQGVSNGIGVFNINPSSGLITSGIDLLALANNYMEFLLTIKAIDGGTPPRSTQHMLTLIPIPVPIFHPYNGTEFIQEELRVGSVISTLYCSEIGPSSNSIEVSLNGSDAEKFRIEQSSLVVARRIDYELLPENDRTLFIVANCINRWSLSDMLIINLTVQNVDDNKFRFTRFQYEAIVPENASAGENILTVSASDRDIPDAMVTYDLQDNILADFVISSTGNIRTHNALDREERAVYQLTIEAIYTTMNGSLMRVTAPLTVFVSDVNDETPRFQDFYYVNNVTTRIEEGDVVITVHASDADEGANGEVTYQLDDNSVFEINETTGEIYVVSYLLPQLYILTVNATDSGDEPRSSQTFVYVRVQPSPNRIQLTLTENPIIVFEDNLIGSQIGQVHAVVIDDSNTTLNSSLDLTLTYEIVNGTDQDRFTINRRNGAIYSLGNLDYDALAREYDLIIRVTLSGGDFELAEEVVAQIMVENIDDNPPLFMPSLYAVSIEQFTLPGTTILSVFASDPDGLESIRYDLVGTDSDPFQIDNSTGEITAITELDTPRDYRFHAVASDGGDIMSFAVVYISVTRSTSVGVSFTRTLYSFPLLESAPPGTFVGKVSALTRGNHSSEEFSHLGFRINMPDMIVFNVTDLLPLINLSQPLFHIDVSSGNISTLAMFEFDLETRQDYVFYVEVYNIDSGSVYDYAWVEVRLQDVNDNPPVFSQSLYTSVINTSQPLHSVIISLSATDRDSFSNSQITYSFEDPDSILGFALNHSSGSISISNPMLLIPGDYHLTVIASDGGFPVMFVRTTVFVAVIPVTPEDIEFTEEVYNFNVYENSPPNSIVGSITALPTNSSLSLSNVTYSTPNITNLCFNIDPRSGEIRISCTSLDRESTASYQLLVIAQVDDIEAYGTVKINLLDINDNAPVFNRDIYTAVIDDGHGNRTSILQVMAEDIDIGYNGTFTYEIIPHDNEIFRINSTTGELFLIDEVVPLGDYRLSVKATDTGTPFPMSSYAIVLICITRAQPQTLNFESLEFNVMENVPSGTDVGTVTLRGNGGSIVNPADFQGNLHFSIVSGDTLNLFFINPNNGTVTTSALNVDREEAPYHIIEILANFTQFSNIPVNHVQEFFTIEVLDVNDNAPRFDQHLYYMIIDDDADTDEVIFNITVTDIDAPLNSEISFRFESITTSAFGVRVTNVSHPHTYAEIYINDTNSLMAGDFRFTIIATDSGVTPLIRTAAVDIIVNHAIPEEINFSLQRYTFNISEETPPDTPVGNVLIDNYTPALATLIYSITGGSGEEYFIINSATGEIQKTHRRIDRETISELNLTISAFLPDQDPPLIANTFVTVTINDVNDNVPIFTEAVYPSVSIETDEINVNTVLLNVSATDRDAGTNAIIDYGIQSIIVDNSLYYGNEFHLNRSSGEIFITSQMVNVGAYHFNISGSDRGRLQLRGYTSVTIIVQQPAPHSISFMNQTGYTFTLSEEMGIVTAFAHVMLESIPDYLLQFVSYTTDDSNFTVAQSSGAISSRRNFDYEIEKYYTFEVTSRLDVTIRTPEIHLISHVNVTIQIIDINDNTPYFTNFPSEITQYENRSTLEVVYNFTANDSDSGSNSRLRYEILNSDLPNGMLNINEHTGALSAAAGLDRESSIEGAIHRIIIRVCDVGSGPRCVQNSTNFRLLDINDNTPNLTSGLVYSAEERRPAGTDVFSFVGTDPDFGVNGTIRYSIISTDAPIQCNTTTGQATLREELDFERRTSYNITIRLSDTGTPSLSRNYSIILNVANLPDNTPQFVFPIGETAYHNDTDPTVQRGDLLYRVQAFDEDMGSSNDILMYAITNVQQTGNDVLPRLTMEPTTGQIVGSVDQIFVPEATFTVSILVYDQSNFNLSNTSTVVINVIPDPLSFTQTVYTATISEQAHVGTLVTILPIQALSVSSNIMYSFGEIRPRLGGQRKFTIGANGAPAATISLSTSGTGLDREDIDTYVIEVRASRMGIGTRPSETAQTNLTVTVSDENDNDPYFIDRNYTIITIKENLSSRTVISRSNASDLDIGVNARLMYRLEPSPSPFRVNSSTGFIDTVGVLDYEVTSTYNITIFVEDSGQPRRSNRIIYTINLINLNDNFPVFSALAYFGEVYARASRDDIVLHTEIRVTDDDDVNGELPLTFTINTAIPFPFQEMYRFRIDSLKPYQIRVDTIPEEADRFPRLLNLTVEVSDGSNNANVPLFISIFTSNNLGFFILQRVMLEELLSCVVSATSLCGFRRAVAVLTEEALSTSRIITFYNNTVVESSTDSERLVTYL